LREPLPRHGRPVETERDTRQARAGRGLAVRPVRRAGLELWRQAEAAHGERRSVVTDNGIRSSTDFGRLERPQRCHPARIAVLPGVIDHGLFVNLVTGARRRPHGCAHRYCGRTI
jgi:ribose 5-phosphate isomerase